MSFILPNSIHLLTISPFSTAQDQNLETVESTEPNEPIGERVDPFQIHRLVVKGVNQKLKRSHYTIGDQNESKSCGPVLQIIPRDTQVIIRDEITTFVSKQNIHDGRNTIDHNEIGIKIGVEDTDLLLVLGSNGCVLIECGAFTNKAFNVENESIFVINPDGQYAQMIADRQRVLLFSGGHVVLLGSRITVIVVGASGFNAEELTLSDLNFPKETLIKFDESETGLKQTKNINLERIKTSEQQTKTKIDVSHVEGKSETLETRPQTEVMAKVPEEGKSKYEIKQLEYSEKTQNLIENNRKFEDKLPKSTYGDLNELSSDHKFLELIRHLSRNTWYFRGIFGHKLFISKVYNKDLLAPLHRNHYLDGELSIANELVSRILENENLVTVLKVIVKEHNVFIFMDNYWKTAAELVMQSGPQSEGCAKRLIKQVLGALDYLHSKGIAHRNVKLDNIYINRKDNNLEAKLADFTCAIKCLRDGKIIRDMTWVGTEEYMPPEILEQVLHDPRKSDIWSLGVCLFVFLHDCFPFKSGDQIRTDHGRDRMLNRQLSRKYLIPESIDLSVNCIGMYHQLMIPDFSVRPNARQALKHTWIQQ